MEITLHQPHDALFKAAFNRKEVMVDFLASRLPRETLARIDLTTLRLTNKSFVSQAGKQTHSDLIYSALIDKQLGYLYIVIEHFSEPAAYIPLKQLEYNLPLYRQHLQEGHKKLPIILNICVYSGAAPYKGPITPLEMFEHPELAKQYLLEEYYLVDLRTDSVEQIAQDKKAALAELLLKQGKLRDFYNWLEEHAVLLQKLEAPYAEEAFLYILSLDNRDETFERLKKNTNPKQREVVMSVAERLIQQGMQQGMQQGVQQGMQTEKMAIAKNMLFQLHLGIDVVEQATGLNKEALAQLANQSH